MSWLFIGLLACAVLVVVGAEWPRLAGRAGPGGRRQSRVRTRKKSQLRLVRTDSDEFVASVERDLANLPTIEERDAKR